MYLGEMDILNIKNCKMNFKINKPKTIKVIRKKEKLYSKNGITTYVPSWWSPKYGHDKYYSSILDDKQYIYSFLDTTSSENCLSFLLKHKEIYNRYPDLHSSELFRNNEDCDPIYIDTENYSLMAQRCLINNISLIGISNFEYTFYERYLDKKNVFNVNISAVDLLENQILDTTEQVENLNYLLDF
jgi:hypothetical protein